MKKLLSVLIALVIVLTGCGSSSSDGDAKGVVYYIPISDVGPFWQPVGEAAEAKAAELGYTLEKRTTPFGDPDEINKKIGYLDEAANNPDTVGIIFSAVDEEAFDRKLGEIKEAEIPIVTFDGDTKTKENRNSYTGTDNYTGGTILGQMGAKYLKDQGVTSGKVQIIEVNNTQTTMKMRQQGVIDGFNDEMGADASNYEFLEPINDDNQSAESKAAFESILIGNDDVVAVFSTGGEGPANGAMEALRSSGKQDQVSHFSFDYSPSFAGGVDDGLVRGIVDQDSTTIGETTVEIVDKLNNGEEVDETYPIQVKPYNADELKDLLKERGDM